MNKLIKATDKHYLVSGNWSLIWRNESCTVVESAGTKVRCRCREQGLFSVLMSSSVIIIIDVKIAVYTNVNCDMHVY